MFSTRLKTLRASKGMTQVKLAEMLGVAQQTVASWEKEKSYPNYELLKKISQIFNASIDYILENNIPIKTEAPSENEYTSDEKELIRLYRFTDEWGKGQVMRTAEENAKRIAMTERKTLEVAM